MKYGYARVSTTDQSCEVQEKKLREYGCDTVRSERQTGTKLAGRRELASLLEFMREGDTLVVTRLDRLARSVLDLHTIVRDLNAKGVALVCTEQPVDTTTATGKMMLGMLAVIAEFETELRRERQMEGIEAAKKSPKKVYRGRPKTIDRDAVREDFAKTRSLIQTARNLGVSTDSVWRITKTPA